MKFSLILATLNRSKEISDCLKSLKNQKEKNFEVIIVDQSKDDLTKMVVEKFLKSLEIKYYKVKFTGLSKARNYGLNYTNGDYIGLLDDDAIYKDDYLLNAKKEINQNENNKILSGKILSITNHESEFIKYNKIKRHKNMKLKDIIGYCPSAALIFPKKIIDEVGGFDERLGVGNEFASGEETEFILRAYDRGYIVNHVKEMIAYHPIKPVTDLNKVFKHYEGMGALFKIDLYKNKKMRLIPLYLKNTLGMLIKSLLDKKNKSIYMTRLNGFVAGIKKFKL